MMKTSQRYLAVRFLALAPFALAACNAGDAVDPGLAAGGIHVQLLSAPAAFVPCGEEIPIALRVTDDRGKPMRNFLVNFTVTAGGGSMFAGSAVTDNFGEARDHWKVGATGNTEQAMAVRAVDPKTGEKLTFSEVAVSTTGRIVHYAWHDNLSVRFLARRPDGSDALQLPLPSNVADVAWSPDGSLIAMARTELSGHPGIPSTRAIWTMRPDGSELTKVGPGALDESPSWSPDGSRILFVSRASSPFGAIHTMRSDGSDLRWIPTPDLTFSPVEPRWSPDFTRIAFHSTDPGASANRIYVMNADGSSLTPLPLGSTVAWSPDSRRLAYIDEPMLMVAEANGAFPRQLAAEVLHARYPAWSPDGRTIAFSGWNGFTEDVYLVPANGSGTATNVTGETLQNATVRHLTWTGCTPV